ncbi:hypothetical protein A2W24_05995 [Microgenomates group bacterium RBG_16_45_19]|nr:MAG: hypothetical protein A2W24_05995 [Microgenomates group bacterium RBG_16_45_19]
MAKINLNHEQNLFLKQIRHSSLSQSFYFTGGTALAYYYLQHRLSEDLDFFSKQEFEPLEITTYLKSLKDVLAYKSFDFQSSFNRNIYQLRFGQGRFLKVEFTYFPFEQIELPRNDNCLLVDSLTDIAANKLFTIAQKPRGRDYYDLYAIQLHQPIDFKQLRLQAKAKFDWHIDPLQLGTQFNRVAEFMDDPILTKRLPRQAVINFFSNLAKSFKDEFLLV